VLDTIRSTSICLRRRAETLLFVPSSIFAKHLERNLLHSLKELSETQVSSPAPFRFGENSRGTPLLIRLSLRAH
jgi:hypothetical protein